MNIIRLNRDGTLSSKKRIIEEDPLSCLSLQVELAIDCTLRSFFFLLTSHPVLQRLNAFIPTYLAEIEKCPRYDCRLPGVAFLVLQRIVEMTGFPGNAAMRIYITLEGMQKEGARVIKSAGLAQLLDMPLQLGRLKHTVFGDQVHSLEFDTAFTLFELIDGICWELSFHNLPENCRIG